MYKRQALLRYATHTLSFDEWGGRGECSLVALLHALHSVEALLYELVADDFHLRIRIEKPDSYPNRQVILIDEAPWSVECEQYEPTYHVDPAVLAAGNAPGGKDWAQSEDFAKAGDAVISGKSTRTDDQGRPLNPRGRTGLGGRGLLGRWAVNPAVAAIVVRARTDGEGLEFLVGKLAGQLGASIPRDFLKLGEAAGDGLSRLYSDVAGIDLGNVPTCWVFDDFYYDFRQTDHAWVELEAAVVGPDDRLNEIGTGPTEQFDETDWWPMDADSMNKLRSADAMLLERAIESLRTSGHFLPGYGQAPGSEPK